ncbi:MAG: radical SAM protein [Treponema sp.]|jgi:putative pyruvate formate lyase activating enzyme|nr:radical SAM protein [Treponema sp.]
MKDFYSKCLLCPRACAVDRNAGRRGFCGETAELRIASASIHRGEEPPVTGAGGSGTIFISGCNLGCVFCQNYQISKNNPGGCMGRVVHTGEFAEICLALQKLGAENINIVTGSHAAPAIAKGLVLAKERGLVIPVLWNSSGYEGMETLEILKDLIDVYLPDLKTLDSGIAGRFFYAPDYPENAKRAILKMMELRPLNFGPGRGGAAVMRSGVMIRHLVLPGCLEAAKEVLRWVSGNCTAAGHGAAGRALLSVMTQYTPLKPAAKEAPDRHVSEKEYDTILGWLEELGIDDGFCQEPVSGSEWLPDFSRTNPFPSELSKPVWHWKSRWVIFEAFPKREPLV